MLLHLPLSVLPPPTTAILQSPQHLHRSPAIATRKVLTLSTLLCTASLLLVSGCKKPVTSKDGLFPITLQTDWYPQPEHGGFYQALLKGYYKQEGLDVTIAPGGPYIFSDQQVAAGNADFGMASSDKLLVAQSHGLPLVAIAATMQHDPQCIMLHKDSPITGFPALDGHTIAVQPGSTWFQYIVKRFNLANVREIPATYSVANFLADPNYIQQAFITSEPFFARKAGQEVRTLQISDTGYDPYRVYFTRQKFIAEHPDIVAKFVRASTRGWRDYIADPSLANADINHLNPAMSVDQMEFSARTLKDLHFETGSGPAGDQLGRFTPDRWATMYNQLVDLKVITNPIDPKSAYTLQFLPQ